ncbi:MAG: hypothetical protein IJB93_01205 [Clostridia bacterium]|nr:hypothetical protein [Clostridia bacterium]
MLKKATSFLSKLNIFCIFVFFVTYIIVRLDILPEDIFAFWIGTMFLSGATVLLFIISIIFQWVKNKKFPSGFTDAVSCFFTALWLTFEGYLIYGVYTFSF